MVAPLRPLVTWWQHVCQVTATRRQSAGVLRDLNAHMGSRRLMAMQGFVCHDEAAFFVAWLRQNKNIRRIVEIGFNAGHSACMFLGARGDTTVVSFDIGHQAHSLHAKRFIDQRFPGRHTLVVGDSRQTVPWYADQGAQPADLILIDGGHAEQIAAADLSNMRRLAVAEETAVIMDDLVPWRRWGVGPTRVWDRAIAGGIVRSSFYLRNGQVTHQLGGQGRDKVCGVGYYLP